MAQGFKLLNHGEGMAFIRDATGGISRLRDESPDPALSPCGSRQAGRALVVRAAKGTATRRRGSAASMEGNK